MLIFDSLKTYGSIGSKKLFLQLVDEYDGALMESEAGEVERLGGADFRLVAVPVSDWQNDLVPWAAEPVFGGQPFGDGAARTLDAIVNRLLPAMGEYESLVICGYSLAGLFALWVAYSSGVFDGAVAASPSVWYPNWLDFAEGATMRAKNVYLSLGDREEKAKNPRLASVGQAIRRQHELLTAASVNATLEWNEGNHFVNSDKRVAKGIAWMLKNL